MSKKSRYILASLLVTFGSYIWYSSILHHTFGMILILMNSMVINPASLSEKVKVERVSVVGFLGFISIALLIFCFIILMKEIPDGRFEYLLSQWYFTGSFWLAMILLNYSRYIREVASKDVLNE